MLGQLWTSAASTAQRSPSRQAVETGNGRPRASAAWQLRTELSRPSALSQHMAQLGSDVDSEPRAPSTAAGADPDPGFSSVSTGPGHLRSERLQGTNGPAGE